MWNQGVSSFQKSGGESSYATVELTLLSYKYQREFLSR